LGDEPANKDTLPEEASSEDLDLQELKDSALNATPMTRRGSRTIPRCWAYAWPARASDWRSMPIPAQTTQKIQERIVIELDGLAKMAQEQEEQSAQA
jgi:hypothetical protein